jgi:hypothetical protein
MAPASHRDSSQTLQFQRSITEQLAHYAVVFQKLVYVLRVLPNRRAILTEAQAQWQTNPAVQTPPAGDTIKIAEFFAACDEICSSQPTDPHEYVQSP